MTATERMEVTATEKIEGTIEKPRSAIGILKRLHDRNGLSNPKKIARFDASDDE